MSYIQAAAISSFGRWMKINNSLDKYANPSCAFKYIQECINECNIYTQVVVSVSV